ncbi:hypothetical protein [Burkholderia cenocepacia]|uniref:hypothetical protein n=1 Tax=Burkholderia cenocepacia TaxID=95486 RepID=UPI000F57E335|nr:hypothetical protein [Burkholderia cenocepacia]
MSQWLASFDVLVVFLIGLVRIALRRRIRARQVGLPSWIAPEVHVLERRIPSSPSIHTVITHRARSIRARSISFYFFTKSARRCAKLKVIRQESAVLAGGTLHEGDMLEID